MGSGEMRGTEPSDRAEAECDTRDRPHVVDYDLPA